MNLLKLSEMTSLRRLLFLNGAGGGLTEYDVTGNPVSFNTNVAKPLRRMLIPFAPVQDLHGQSSPYPAGGGKNKIGFIDASGIASGTNKTVSVANEKLTVTASGSVSSSSVVSPTAMESICITRELPVGTYTFSLGNFSTSVTGVTKSSILLVLSDSTEVSQGSSFAITEGVTINYIKANTTLQWTANSYISFNVQIESGSSATDWSPYSNICPITGWTGLNVIRTGINLFNNDTTLIHAVTKDDGETVDTRYGYELYLPPGTYTIKAERKNPSATTSRYIYGGVYKKAGNHLLVTQANIWVNKTGNTKTITVAEDEFVQYFYGAGSASLSDVKTYLGAFNITMNVGDTVGDYSEYVGTTIPVTFPAMGKNLLNPATNTENKTISADGTIADGSTGNYTALISVEEGASYTLSGISGYDGTIWRRRIHGYDSDGEWVQQIGFYETSTNKGSPYSKTVSIPNGITYVRISYCKYDTNVQFEKGSSATSYEEPTTTAYGGTLDLTTGELTAEWVKVVADGVNVKVNVAYTDVGKDAFGAGIVFLNPPGESTGNKVQIPEKIKCDMFPIITGKVEINSAVVPTTGQLYIVFFIGKISEHPEITTNAERITFVNNWLEDHNTTIVYKLITPIVYQLTPGEITTLIGDNTIWSDTNGENTITYKKKG